MIVLEMTGPTTPLNSKQLKDALELMEKQKGYYKRPAAETPPPIKKTKVAKKLTFEETETATPRASLEEDVLNCYCSDPVKKCDSKEGREFQCCSHSRYEREEKKWVSDCDFFVWTDQLAELKCKCGFPLRHFEMKDNSAFVNVCLYKNAPTAYKKLHNYKCDEIIKIKK